MSMLSFIVMLLSISLGGMFLGFYLRFAKDKRPLLSDFYDQVAYPVLVAPILPALRASAVVTVGLYLGIQLFFDLSMPTAINGLALIFSTSDSSSTAPDMWISRIGVGVTFFAAAWCIGIICSLFLNLALSMRDIYQIIRGRYFADTPPYTIE